MTGFFLYDHVHGFAALMVGFSLCDVGFEAVYISTTFDGDPLLADNRLIENDHIACLPLRPPIWTVRLCAIGLVRATSLC